MGMGYKYTCTFVCVYTHETDCYKQSPQHSLILGHQRVIGGHFVVNGDRHGGLQVTCS